MIIKLNYTFFLPCIFKICINLKIAFFFVIKSSDSLYFFFFGRREKGYKNVKGLSIN